MKAEFDKDITITLSLKEFFNLDIDAQIMIMNLMPVGNKEEILKEMDWGWDE